MRMRKPKCPYCGAKLNYAKAWTLKRRGEYICPKCGGLADVRLDPLLYRLGILAILAAAGFFAAGWFSDSAGSVFWTVPGVIFPPAVFFLLSVFFVRLKKPVSQRRTDTAARGPQHSAQPPSGAGGFSAPRRTAGRGSVGTPPR